MTRRMTTPLLTLDEIAMCVTVHSHVSADKCRQCRLLATARAYHAEMERADQAECAHAGCAVAYDIVEAARAQFQAENARLRAVVDIAERGIDSMDEQDSFPTCLELVKALKILRAAETP